MYKCIKCGDDIGNIHNLKEHNLTCKSRYVTQATRDKISKSMKAAVLKNPDAFSWNNSGGRIKTYEYKDTKLRGTWELIVAKWLDENNLKWTNELKGIPYEWEGSTHSYFPDFYLFEYDLYIEVKGYQRNKDVAKWNTVDNLIIFKKLEINLIKNGKFDTSILDNFTKNVYEYDEEKPKRKLYDIIKEKHYCIECGNEIKGRGTKNHKYCCVGCYNKVQSKNVPPQEDLLIKFEELKTYVAIGAYYKVSDVSVKKWCKKYNIIDIVKNIK